jgi:DNA helicase HerA-like ATPase
VGHLPLSNYPIHVDIHEVVTHHSAILGITGTGKTVLAYELIRKMIDTGIRVLVFDVSCDYALDLAEIPNLTKLTKPSDVHAFLASTSMLGIAEFQPTTTSLPSATAATVHEVLVWAKQHLQTQGFQKPQAKICVVFEEAHSLIPEWNSAGSPADKDHVNRTSQTILQGRKYGVGALVITQRTANITKTILNQCNTIFALQSFDQTGLEFLKNYIGEQYAYALSTLLKRQVVIFGKASSSRRPVIARLNEVAMPTAPLPAQTPIAPVSPQP